MDAGQAAGSPLVERIRASVIGDREVMDGPYGPRRIIYALAFVSPTTEKVVSTGVPTELIRGDVFFWQSLQAAAILVAVPIAFVFNLFLDRFISGFTMGAVKG